MSRVEGGGGGCGGIKNFGEKFPKQYYMYYNTAHLGWASYPLTWKYKLVDIFIQLFSYKMAGNQKICIYSWQSYTIKLFYYVFKRITRHNFFKNDPNCPEKHYISLKEWF